MARQSDGVRAELFLLGRWQLDMTPVLRQSLGSPARKLMALLALRGPMTRSQAAGTLWPEITEAAAAARLRTVLWRLHDARRLVEEDDGALVLCRQVAVDVDRMRVDALLLDRQDLAEVHDAMSINRFAADLLPGWYDDWLAIERERIRELRIHALESIAARLVRDGRFTTAVDAALMALRADPLRESAFRCVITAHLAEGNVAAALRQFDECRRIMKTEMGIDPSPSLAALLPGAPGVTSSVHVSVPPHQVEGSFRRLSSRAVPPRW